YDVNLSRSCERFCFFRGRENLNISKNFARLCGCRSHRSISQLYASQEKCRSCSSEIVACSKVGGSCDLNMLFCRKGTPPIEFLLSDFYIGIGQNCRIPEIPKPVQFDNQVIHASL